MTITSTVPLSTRSNARTGYDSHRLDGFQLAGAIFTVTWPAAARSLGCSKRLEQDRFNDVSGDVRESIVAATMAVGKLLMVQAHQVQDRSVQVVDMNFVLHGAKSEVIGCPVSCSTSHTSTCHPDGEAPRVMVSTVGVFGSWRTTEFSAPEDECIVEHSTLFKIFQQGSDGLVDVRA